MFLNFRITILNKHSMTGYQILGVGQFIIIFQSRFQLIIHATPKEEEKKHEHINTTSVSN